MAVRITTCLSCGSKKRKKIKGDNAFDGRRFLKTTDECKVCKKSSGLGLIGLRAVNGAISVAQAPVRFFTDMWNW